MPINFSSKSSLLSFYLINAGDSLKAGKPAFLQEKLADVHIRVTVYDIGRCVKMAKVFKSVLMLVLLYGALSSSHTILDDVSQLLAANTDSTLSMDPEVVVVLVDEGLPVRDDLALALRCLVERIAQAEPRAIGIDYTFQTGFASALPMRPDTCFMRPEWREPAVRDSPIPRLAATSMPPTVVAAEFNAKLARVIPQMTLVPPNTSHVAGAGFADGPWAPSITILEADSGRVRRLPLLTESTPGQIVSPVGTGHFVLATWLSGLKASGGRPVTQDRMRACALPETTPEADADFCAALLGFFSAVDNPAPALRFRQPDRRLTILRASTVAGFPPSRDGAGRGQVCALDGTGFSDTSCAAFFRRKYVLIGPGRISDGDFLTTPLTPLFSIDLLSKPIGGISVRSEFPGAVVLGLFLDGLVRGSSEFIRSDRIWSSVAALLAALVGVLTYMLGRRDRGGIAKETVTVFATILGIAIAVAVQAYTLNLWSLSIGLSGAMLTGYASWLVADYFFSPVKDAT
ncbi:CHASE2 domain-containing protein [Sedimentitalea sp. JM2-8]|uniref:CHASE2 domain-containing protein n=1 Tax=Sedimentitalea xiamensis TaxID=3050037 RepID=A0ABT7FKV8_9RHOB|nr:CHASE2 domain-containing protein [Sedimentitalea xiamensis]MDK3075645.1 CHASE2 domain-containing protein [Sedimentitalea xiamensis]